MAGQEAAETNHEHDMTIEQLKAENSRLKTAMLGAHADLTDERVFDAKRELANAMADSSLEPVNVTVERLYRENQSLRAEVHKLKVMINCPPNAEVLEKAVRTAEKTFREYAAGDENSGNHAMANAMAAALKVANWANTETEKPKAIAYLTLEEIARELQAKEEWWRNSRNDPHQIGNAVMMAIHEVRAAIVDAMTLKSMEKGHP